MNKIVLSCLVSRLVLFLNVESTRFLILSLHYVDLISLAIPVEMSICTLVDESV
jgi:hypothetical protein